jgi:6-phosphogluconolactonase
VIDGAEDLALRGAGLISAAARDAVASRGSFTLALSGGHNPWLMCERLADEEIAWESVEILQVDERIAPDGDPDRNLTHMRETLPAAALERLRAMPVTDEDPEAAAARYAEGLPEAIDLVHLGLGPDGHTASLVPGDPVLEVDDRPVAVTGGAYQGRRRMTLTYPALAAARDVFWLVTGADKRDALAKLLAGDTSVPGSRVEAHEAIVLADPAAAAGRAR